MTPTHYLRVEGVNLGAFVFDTRDLSTIRGASLMLLDAVEIARSELEGRLGKDKVCVLSQGASSGLFELDTADPCFAARAVREILASARPHATFVVDVAKISDDFRRDVESLLAANRWRQMQATSLAVPPANGAQRMTKPACELDGVRPAVNETSHGAPNRGDDKAAFTSDSVYKRREHGRGAKQKFYGEVVRHVAERLSDRAQKLKKLADTLPDFAQDFAAIADKKDTALNRKLAVFYADGNHFGSTQSKLCTSARKQIAFDQLLRFSREELMTDFLEVECAKDEWWHEKDGRKFIRFETLLWGGDEVMFVMPAALGWRFARLFFEKLGGLNLKDAGAGLPDTPLSHAAALVFCQDHAPIDRIKRLLKDQMAQFAKEIDRSLDSLVVVALESFDHLGSGYEEAMTKRYQGVIGVEDMVLRGRDEPLAATLAAIGGGVESLRRSESFARSQLRFLVTEMLTLTDPDGASKRAKFREEGGQRWPPREFRRAEKEERKLLWQELRPRFASDVALWIQLEELWDYARP